MTQADITTTSESRLAGIPHELRFVVDKLLLMHDSGWEVCGFQGGGSGKIQFQKVEWRRPRHAVD